MGLSLRKPAFAIPELLQLQGIVLDGYGTPFWDVAPTGQATEDVAALLKAVHPLLIRLTLAGYEIQRLIFSIKGAEPSKLLDIDLATLRYDIVETQNTDDGHSNWYARTGVEWTTGSDGTSQGSIPTLTSDTWSAAAIIFQARDRWATGEVTYALDLHPMLTSGNNLLADVPYTDQGSLVVYELIPSTTQPPDLKMSVILQSLSFWTVLSDGVFRERWLSVDCQPVGLLDNLNPDLVVDCLHHGSPVAVVTRPSRWGTPSEISAAAGIIIQDCRDVWQYLQSIADYSTAFGRFGLDPANQLLDAAWKYLVAQGKATLPPIPSSVWLREFLKAVRDEVEQLSGYTLTDDFLGKLEKLAWVELLMLLHNMFVIDLLSGVSVDDNTSVIAPALDLSGFYASADGLVTVQLNQGASYVSGFMEVRRPISVAGVSAQYHQIDYDVMDGSNFWYPGDDHETVPPRFTLTGQTISTNSDGQPVLAWALSSGKHYTLTRYAEMLALPDEALNGLPRDAHGDLPEAAQVVVLSQRAPLSPVDESYLYDAADIVKAYLQAYLGATTPTGGPSGIQLDQWLADLEKVMGSFVALDPAIAGGDARFPVPATDDNRHKMENDQFPLVHYHLRDILQSTALEVSETDTRTLYQGFLDLIISRGVQHLQPIDKYILYISGISTDDATALTTPQDMKTLTDGAYVYEFRVTSVSVGGGLILGASVAPSVVDVRRLSSSDSNASVLWTTRYFGIFEAGGLAIGGKVDLNSLARSSLKFLLENAGASAPSWSRLYAKTQWEPSDFEGLVTIAYRQAGFCPGIGLQFTFYSLTTFWEISKGTDLGYGRLTSVTENTTFWDVMAGSSWMIAQWSFYWNAFVGEANLVAIPLVGDVNEDGFFEPLVQGVSYTSDLPTVGTGVHFAVDSATLTPDGVLALEQLTAKFRAYLVSTQTLLEIHGYASPKGSEDYNLDLSDRRAQAVYDELYAILGSAFAVPTQRTIVMGHGEYDAKYIDKIPDGTEIQKWRRVDIVINGALVCSVFGEKGAS